jgi:hypothetical protein
MAHSPAAYEKNVTKQYEALGRFVEAFEMMVNEARGCCIKLLGRGLTSRQVDLVAIPLHHQSFSAKAIFETFRTVLVETIKHKKFAETHGLSEEGIDDFSSVLAATNSEYESLANKRNNLLHGTWFVGYRGSHDPDAETFYVSKFTTSGEGLKAVKLPKTTAELDTLRERCEQTRTWITTIHACVPPISIGKSFADCFKRKGKQWERTWPSPHRFP